MKYSIALMALLLVTGAMAGDAEIGMKQLPGTFLEEIARDTHQVVPERPRYHLSLAGNFYDFDDLGMVIGGYFGFIPVKHLELGVSLEYGERDQITDGEGAIAWNNVFDTPGSTPRDATGVWTGAHIRYIFRDKDVGPRPFIGVHYKGASGDLELVHPDAQGFDIGLTKVYTGRNVSEVGLMARLTYDKLGQGMIPLDTDEQAGLYLGFSILWPR